MSWPSASPPPSGLRRAARLGASARGSVFVYIFIAIMVLAALSYAVSQSTKQQADSLTVTERDEQIGRLFAQLGAVSSAVTQMQMNGADPATLYSDIAALAPGEAGWDTAPHTYKIFHPMGGGISYMEATGDPAAEKTLATGIDVNPESVIEGVGATDAVVGDIVFVATIASEAACQRINQKLTGSTTIPVMQDAAYASLFSTVAATTVNAAACASCVNVPEICVVNASGDAWGFYAAMLPG